MIKFTQEQIKYLLTMIDEIKNEYQNSDEDTERQIYTSECFNSVVFQKNECINDENEDYELVKSISNFYDVMSTSFKKVLSAAKLSQSEFARRFFIPIRTVQDWCSGERRMPMYLRLLIVEKLELI